MMIVGLTGGIGSGKTTVLRLFQKLGVPCYVADVEAKRLMGSSETIKNKIINVFGNDAYNKDALDRKYIASIVFQNQSKLKKLNAIVHPVVKKDFLRFVKKQEGKYVIYESAILFESKSYAFCDLIISVVAPLEVRIKRVMKRDKVQRKDVLVRINNQSTDTEKMTKSDFKIENLNLTNLKSQVDEIHKWILDQNQILKKSNDFS